ncbi:MAG: hypothetical protein K8T26_00410 [Lentisphaerae bacterium]|nr:hypothetical protein [Lentisphaerota bacterium]
MIVHTDLDINRAIRRVLVKHWIDLGRISIRTTNGRILFFGYLRRIEGHRDNLSPPALDAMFYEISRIRGVQHVRTHFDNWSNDGGRWHPFERVDMTDRRGGSQSSGTGTPPAPEPGPV